MSLLIMLLIINSIGILIIYGLYRLFDWLLIKRDPILNPVKKNQIPYFFTDENCECTLEDKKDQNNFTLTEIVDWGQTSNKTTQNEPIIDDISTYNNEKVIL